MVCAYSFPICILVRDICSMLFNTTGGKGGSGGMSPHNNHTTAPTSPTPVAVTGRSKKGFFSSIEGQSNEFAVDDMSLSSSPHLGGEEG